jgi:putative ABC transport system permease protein
LSRSNSPTGLGARLFRIAASTFPGNFARSHIEEMTTTFERELERIRRRRGKLAGASYAARASWDAFRQGLRERVRRGPPPGHGGREPSSEARIGSGLGSDLHIALRGMRRNPGFTFAAVAVLALGIGANATVFSALRVVVLTPPPYPRLDRLVVVDLVNEHLGRAERRVVTWSSPKFEAFLEVQNRLIEPVAGYANRSATLTGFGPATRIPYELVSPSYFRTLGVTPVVGRTLGTEEGHGPEGSRIAILSHELWMSRFGGSASALDEDITLEGTSLRIVGVAPEGFHGLSGDAQVWVPLGVADELFGYGLIEQSGAHWFHVVGRLRPDATLEEAAAQMASLGDGIAELYPSGDPQSVWTASARAFEDVRMNEAARAAVVLLTMAAAVVLLVACANLSGLLLARARRRARDGAVRIAIGASRWRIVRGSLVESGLLSILGGATGLGLALWGTSALASAWPRAFLSSAEGEMRVADLSHLGLEPAVLLFASLATALTALLFGAAPAARLSGTDVSVVLKDGSGATRREVGRASLDGRAALVGTQVALALLLLIGAGLLGSSTVRLLSIDEGVTTENVLAFRYAIPETSTWSERETELHDELLARLEALPPVLSATTGSRPLSGHWAITRVDAVEGGPEIPQGEGILIGVHMVGDGYFETLGIPVVSGRVFDATDGTDRFPTIVISERTAERLFPGEDPVGKRIEIGISDDNKESWSEVVGVVGNVLYGPPDQDPMPETYYSNREFGTTSASVLVRTSVEPLPTMPTIRSALTELDPTLAIYGVTTMEEVVAASVGDRRVLLALLGLFAGVAVLLAATGTWGIVAVSVADRRRELGLRIALGADDVRVMGMVLRQSVVTAVLGVAVGLVGGAAASRLLEIFLWDTERLEPAVYAGGTLLLLAVTLLASWIPARGVLRLDPAETLRAE